MTDESWVRLTSFPDLASAEAAAAKVNSCGVMCEILGPLDEPLTADHIGACNLWVPTDSVDEANFALADPAPADEVTKEALESPPPDDA